MMTKQAELKKQAYASTLKSRALSVLIYLIDRSNKELTCFPAIPTMAEQLHISISTVKRALHELLDAGYIKKDARFREKNKGQTSNLYTLVLFEEQPILDDRYSYDCDIDNHTGFEPSVKASQEKDKEEQEICQVEHINFDTLKRMKEVTMEAQAEEVQGTMERTVQEDYEEIRQEKRDYSFFTSGQIAKRLCIMVNAIIKFLYLWTGEGVSLIPP